MCVRMLVVIGMCDEDEEDDEVEFAFVRRGWFGDDGDV